ncbi:hypothetical protein [Candidatus Amarolinea dominans]|uniref:RHS repeat domain-containing protein n=1 Tax=Candidatus Amarolinea dominans TaxID=3140696 RepID=UPI0031CC99B0
MGKHYRNDQNCPATKPATYGTNGLLVAYLYDGGTNGLGRRTQADVYNAGGALNNRVAWTYDARGRVTQESRVINGTGGGTFVTQWGYDSADRPMWQKYPGGNGGQIGEQVSYAHTAQGLLKSVSGWNTYVGDTFYNVRGEVTERRLGSTTGVVKQQYAYSAAENFRLVSLKAGTSPNYDNQQKISYTYDDDGNIQAIADAAAYGGSQTQTFAYDTLDRLSTAQANGLTAYGGYTQRSYAYSNAGNITSFEGAALTYQNSAHKHAVTHIGGVQKYWYDANGNATRRVNGSQDITLTYDAENRLTAMSGSVASSYVYDADGNRVKETISGVTGLRGQHLRSRQRDGQEVLLRGQCARGREQRRHALLSAGRPSGFAGVDTDQRRCAAQHEHGVALLSVWQHPLQHEQPAHHLPLHRTTLGQRHRLVFLSVPLVRPDHRAIPGRGYDRSSAAKSAESEPVQLRRESTTDVSIMHLK